MFEVVSYHASKYDAAVRLKIDLTSYIQSLEKYFQKQEEPLIDDVRIQYNQAFLNFHGISGALLWQQIVSELFNLTSFSVDEVKKIKSSALFMHFKNFAGIEIIKNAADECLYRFFSTQDYRSIYTIELFFMLKVNAEHLVFDIHDTGRGFSDSLLENLSNTAGLCHYLLQDGSGKSRHLALDEPKSFRTFGGCGIGLRELISHIKFSESFIEMSKKILGLSVLPLAEKIRVLSSQMEHHHQLIFQNSEHGAEIKIVMPMLSKQAHCLPSDIESPEKKMVLQSPAFFKFLRNKQVSPEGELPGVFAKP
jgi:hypothetical protein